MKVQALFRESHVFSSTIVGSSIFCLLETSNVFLTLLREIVVCFTKTRISIRYGIVTTNTPRAIFDNFSLGYFLRACNFVSRDRIK